MSARRGEKCLRTMVNPTAADALDRCATFDHALDLDRIARTRPRDANQRSFIEENLDALRRQGRHPELQAALAQSLQPPPPPAPATVLSRMRARVRRLPGMDRVVRLIRGR